MAYDEDLANRLRAVLAHEPGVSEKAMFGGLGFLIDGRLAVGAGSQGDLMVRVDPADSASLTRTSGVQPFEMRGRPMTGWLRISGAALDGDEQLRSWVSRGLARARAVAPEQPAR